MNWDLVNTDEYRLLMQVANNEKLMDQFYEIMKKHSEFEGNHDENCYFCLIFLNW